MGKKIENRWEIALLNVGERLREPLQWYPYPALISFSLVMLLSGHLLPGLNPRLGSLANIITFATEAEREGAIWVGIYPEGEELIAVTSDRKRFQWSLVSSDKRPLTQFSQYLKDRVKREALSVGMLRESNFTKTTVVLAVDQSLKYVHLRPVIYALADAGITNYGFETRLFKN